MTADHVRPASRIERRTLLRGSLATAAVAPFGAAVAGCATGGGDSSSGDKETGKTSQSNPFGVKKGTKIDAVIFKGGYGTDYVEFAGKKVKKKLDDITVKVNASNNISQELQPRFTGGTPPDLIDNSGAHAMGTQSILKKVDALEDVMDAKNYEGKKIKDTLYPGVMDPGTFDGKFKQLNYVMTVYGIWYSQTLFDKHDWEPPKTWDQTIALGKKAKSKGKYLFVWGKEASSYYLTLAIGSAIKEAGDEVRLALENLEPKCWSKSAMQDAFKAIHSCVKAGYFKPGGQGTEFTQAQAQWSKSQDAILYPSGSWIENEMKKQTAKNFKMTGAPNPSLSDSPKLGQKALHSGAESPYLVPSDGKNPAGGKEMLRALLSKDAVTNFLKEHHQPTIVKGQIPKDGYGSSALVSLKKMLDDARDNVFTWRFIDLYGMNEKQLTPMNRFLAGKMDVTELTKTLQKQTDKIRQDDSVKKYKVK